MGWSRIWMRRAGVCTSCFVMAGAAATVEAQSRWTPERPSAAGEQLEIIDTRPAEGEVRIPGVFSEGAGPILPEDPGEVGPDGLRKRRVLVYMSPELGRGAAQRGAVKNLVRNVGGAVKYEYSVVMPNVLAVRNLRDADVEGLRNMPGVVRVEEDVYYPNLLKLDEATPLVRALQSQLTIAGLNVDGAGVRVCVADTGIDTDHIMYADRIDASAGYDFHNDDPNPEDDNGHGAHVSGIAVGRAGLNVDFGCEGPEPFQGVAPAATLIGAKILNASGGGFSSNIIAGIDHCADQSATGGRADVINLSIGTGNFAGPCTHSWAVAANNAVANGVVVVAASGNEARTNSMGSPACGIDVIAVGATYKDDYPNCEDGTSTFNWSVCTDSSPSQDDIVCFSNQSDYLDVAAPGAVIWSASIASGGSSIAGQSGTSMASPMVAGLAALVLDADPTLTPAEVRQILRDGAIDLGPSGFDRAYGHGRIDAINSVDLALGGGGCVDDAECDDGQFCNGFEQCVAGVCEAGTAPNCSDGVACTIDSCNESTDSCDNVADDGFCDDGAFCNGTETCSASQGCQSGSVVNCDDGVACTIDSCNESTDSCDNVADDGFCDDGAFCNGAETCSATQGCQAGGDPCPSEVCDEATDTCEPSGDCTVDADCDDGQFCNGAEICDAGTCVTAPAGGVANGTFDGSDAWTNNIPSSGSISYNGNLTVVGPNSGSQAFTWASQSDVTASGASLEFDLLSYSSSDSGAWDYPVFYLNGTFYGLNADGTLGAATSGGTGGSGTINNNNQVSSTIHFVVDIDGLAGHAGPHTIGFGVASADGAFGAGTAAFDNVTPALSAGGDPCPGQLCDESADACVDCLTDADCDDGLFCNGEETCDGGACAAADVGGVVNGSFDGSTSWTSNTPSGGSISYNGNLRVVGPNSGVGAFTWASQSGVVLNGANLEFDLLSYSSSDIGAWDYPVFHLNGTFYGLNADGTLGAATNGSTGGSGTINNNNQVSSAVHFSVNVDALAGNAGPHTIGFGVASADGAFGAGTATFDNVLPPLGSGDPCPGQSCDEVNDVCVP